MQCVLVCVHSWQLFHSSLNSNFQMLLISHLPDVCFQAHIILEAETVYIKIIGQRLKYFGS